MRGIAEVPSHTQEFVLSGSGFYCAGSAYAPGLRLSAHRHDIANISLVLRGSLEEESERGTVTAGPGCVVFKPAGAAHGNRIGPLGAVIFALRLDPGRSAVACRMREYLWCSQDAALAVMLRLYALSNGARPLCELNVRAGLSAACDGPAPTAFAGAPTWLVSLQQRIHFDDAPSRIGELAREFDTHRVYLARAFRRHLGASPREYQHRLRVTLAAHRLVTTAEPPARIALEVGFADQAHFCRCFRARVGMTPGAYRRLARSV